MVVFSSSCRLLKYRNLKFFRTKSHNTLKNVNSENLCKTFSSNAGTETVHLSDGKKIILSIGKFARFADGCATATLGDTTTMVAAVSKEQVSSSSFVPLTVDYRQKAAAAGRIPTNFLRRELGPSEHEVLVSRLIDRSLRPLFPSGFGFDTQLTCNTLAIDMYYDPDVIAINAASAALSVSDIPWNGPVGAVRVGLVNNKIKLNPTRREIQESELNLIVTATTDNFVVMLEGSANDISATIFKNALKTAVKECQSIVQAIARLQENYGKPKRVFETERDEKLKEIVRAHAETQLFEVLTDYTHDKTSRDVAIKKVKQSVIEQITSSDPSADSTAIDNMFVELIKDTIRKLALVHNKRCDGRSIGTTRDISCEVNVFNPLHGSALFQRGQTQVFCTITLDSLDSAAKLDTVSMMLSGMKEKNFFLHYEFPQYAVNELKRGGPIGRRELGHGALAEKGIRPVLPKDYKFTIRLTSEVFQSNGSSSMASVCGGSLALMDAGVPIKCPVAGVALGLITDGGTSSSDMAYKILTDIQGMEDYFGDMDFKMAGTKNGITAIQADIKIPGLPLEIVMQSISRAMVANSSIIDTMSKVISTPRAHDELKMPVTETIEIPGHQAAKLFRHGGLQMKKIFLQTGVNIYSQEDNKYYLFAPNQAAMTEAREIIYELIKNDQEPTLEFGGIYSAKIVDMRDTGVMVTLHDNMTPTFLPNSQLDKRKINHPSALGFEVGHELQVKYFGRDPVSGQIRISRKVLQEPTTVVKTMLSSPSS